MIIEKITVGNVPMLIYRPNNFDKTKKYPVWLALHGLGEMYRKIESDLFYKVANNGNFSNLLKAADQYGFIVVEPVLVQPNNDWVPGWTDKYLYPAYDYILAQSTTEMDRIAATGLSLGGGGTWVVATGKFAPYLSAAIPICGTSQYACDFSIIAKYSIPVWAFHAKDDVEPGGVSYLHTVNQVKFVQNAYADPAPRITLFDSGGHAIWGTVYADPKLYEWALAQRNASTSVPPPAPTPPPEPFKPTHKIYRADGSSESIRLETL